MTRELKPRPPSTREEHGLLLAGCGPVAGLDEAGRGALAGPVIAAAVVLKDRMIEALGSEGSVYSINDSKVLKPELRFHLARRLRLIVRDFAIGQAKSGEIDRLGIVKATHLAMTRALLGLRVKPKYLLIDGRASPQTRFTTRHRYLVRGDGRSLSIAAASILAKDYRDRLMRRLAKGYPGFGFEKHFGYGTRNHLRILTRFGPTKIHRRKFVKTAIGNFKLKGRREADLKGLKFAF